MSTERSQLLQRLVVAILTLTRLLQSKTSNLNKPRAILKHQNLRKWILGKGSLPKTRNLNQERRDSRKTIALLTWIISDRQRESPLINRSMRILHITICMKNRRIKGMEAFKESITVEACYKVHSHPTKNKLIASWTRIMRKLSNLVLITIMVITN
jgi:hypothetical protein